MTRVAVLGAGSWGTALGDVLARNGHRVTLWCRDPGLAGEIRQGHNDRYLPGVELAGGIGATSWLAEALEEAEVVVSAVPSHVVREVMSALTSQVREPRLISATKGIEIQTDLRMSQVVEEVLGTEAARRMVVLSGPSFAQELVRQLPTAAVAACREAEEGVQAQLLFQNEWFRIYTQGDVVGTELGGSLKNVIALAAGMSDGLRLGDNARAALITRGLAEMTRLAVKLGAEEATLAGLAGIGDLVLTCTGDQSRNRSVGVAIGAGRKPREVLAGMASVVEGFRTARAAHELALAQQVEMPIVNAVYSILYEGLAPREALAALMAREPKPERWS
ncbi:MAG: NAD(P)H-dependent glycerol-3-phosphate dehydrogenase [Gemmatimonadota bacterium]